MPSKLFFDDWAGIARVFLIGIPAYVLLITALRISGKRTLSKMNAFDFVVTIALGSTLATALLSKPVPLAEGVSALFLLIGLQYAVAWASTRSSKVSALVKSEPRMLFYRGDFLHAALRKERVTEAEVRAAAREQGLASMDDVEAVILETEGSLSFVPKAPSTAVLRDVHQAEGR